MARGAEEQRFRDIFRGLHHGHLACAGDEWLNSPCAARDGTLLERPVVWSRRNGPWRRVEVLFVGAAPGNAGGRGSGELGAHGTRIPFGGDIAGANLEVMLGSIGLTRNDTFIVATLNTLPAAGGGEPALHEIMAPAGRFRDSIEVVRLTIIATGPRLIVVLGNVAARATASALSRPANRLVSVAAIQRDGWSRNEPFPLGQLTGLAADFREHWASAWNAEPLPTAVWLVHPSAQNMSPFAGQHTAFHQRMVDALAALRAAAARVLGRPLPAARPAEPVTGIYALPEWKERIAPRNAELDRLWRAKGI